MGRNGKDEREEPLKVWDIPTKSSIPSNPYYYQTIESILFLNKPFYLVPRGFEYKIAFGQDVYNAISKRERWGKPLQRRIYEITNLRDHCGDAAMVAISLGHYLLDGVKLDKV